MSEFTPTWQQPSHPDLIKVVKGDEPYQAAAYSLVSLPAGALFSKITTATPASQDTYTSVANGENSRIELNSDLVYCNHSCDPSLVFDMTKFEVRVSDRRPLAVGDALTFFYPSSEWKMVQPFKCGCNAGAACLGYIAGASAIPSSVLSRYWLNDHVRAFLDRSSNGSEQMAHNMPQSAAEGARVEGAKA
ncbi:uncharacterized protein J7T54_005672 [Emericellopsis cladophorae]|uniref:Galactose-proton symport n=1 Tax=Emericellopsis cladophorae TaxID=2686198 RepID=A0A9P9Y4X1_9HYPO|nr:uncharacterized protein J7T54_005672 [Emericellopsis cladophorae]KAI6783643.1 hypothetical protein J7T54_005672 [Emericellopsis cladophorae]